MKKFIMHIILFLLFLSSENLYADIDAQIRAIQNAPLSKRFKLMNKLKRNMVQMQENERIEALKKLATKPNNKQTKKLLKALEEYSKRKKIHLQMETHHLGEDGILSSLDDQEGD